MKLELIFLIIVGAIIYDTYYDGLVMKYIHAFKKYYKLAGILFVIFSIYITIKKDPLHITNLLAHTTGLLGGSNKYANDMLHSVTNLHNPHREHQPTNGHSGVSGRIPVSSQSSPHRGGGGGVFPTKRSVSETKKKFVAYKQNWRCKGCDTVLNAWYEVDHVVRLEHGGSNDVSNLVALCRECHGEKTATENM